MNAEEVDLRTAELVRLAQRELHGDSPLSDEAGFARLQARIAQAPSFWSKWWRPAGVAVALALSGALSLVLLFRAPPHSRALTLTFEVAGSALNESGRIVATDGTRIRFSDGSDASLSNGTEAKIQNLTEHGAEMVLARGSMRVHIAKKPQAAWNVAAGPYDVRVTGTSFDVSWSKQTQAFDLRMQTGAVIVTGPLAQSGIPVKAGQHMFVVDGKLTVEGGDTTAASPTSAIAEGEPAPESGPSESSDNAPAPLPAVASSGLGSVTRPGREAQGWTRQVAEGHFNVVLEQAEQRGLERTLSSGSLEELAALADAARYAGRSPLAKRVLLAERQRFASSSAARDAAFFLGRIAEDSGSGGVDWYERYLNESPHGGYASQAFGRKMMLLYKQRGAVAARATATEYLSRYPNGPYAAAARKLVQESAAHAP
jgi:FecR-like protein